MWIKKTVAMLVALGIMLCGVSGALAEDDVVADLLYYFLGDSAEQGEEAEAPQQTAPEQADAANEESADYVDGEDYMDEDTGEYGFDEEEEEIVVDKLVEVTDYAVNENLPDDWTNVLLLGTDSRGSTKYLRTDTMIVLSVNANTNEAKMTSILRDTWVEIPEYGWQKLNAACVYGGPELTMRTINQYFGLNLKSYALVNMQCLVNIVDALGGVRLDISPAEAGAMNRLITSDAEASDGNRNFATDKVHSGEQVLLNGKQTLAYARIRKLDTDYAYRPPAHRADHHRAADAAGERVQPGHPCDRHAAICRDEPELRPDHDHRRRVHEAGFGQPCRVPYSRRRHLRGGHVRQHLVHQARFRGQRRPGEAVYLWGVIPLIPDREQPRARAL